MFRQVTVRRLAEMAKRGKALLDGGYAVTYRYFRAAEIIYRFPWSHDDLRRAGNCRGDRFYVV